MCVFFQRVSKVSALNTKLLISAVKMTRDELQKCVCVVHTSICTPCWPSAVIMSDADVPQGCDLWASFLAVEVPSVPSLTLTDLGWQCIGDGQ